MKNRPGMIEGRRIDADVVTDLRARITVSRKVVALTGSGLSAESGLPTFRGTRGLWKTHRVEELASPAGFARDPRTVWSWYNERRAAHQQAVPSDAHRALADFERHRPDFIVATQNVDSLHVRAGSQNVLELHGQLREARCTGCPARRALDGPLDLDEIEHGCGGSWRPDIVWFGESLPQAIWEHAVAAAGAADVMLVIGTSGLVHPAAALATRFASKAYVIEVNPEATAITPHADVSIRATAAEIVPVLLAYRAS